MKKRAIQRLILSVLFSVAFHFSYVDFSYSNFEYAGYKMTSSSFVWYFFAYFLAVLPSIAIRDYGRVSYFFIVLVYVGVYIPSQLMILFNFGGGGADALILSLSMFFAFLILLFFTSFRAPFLNESSRIVSNKTIYGVLFFNGLLVLSLIYMYHSHMRLVGFSDVYSLRFETNLVEVPGILHYAQMWMTYAFIPFFIAVGVCKKSIFYVLFSVFLSLLIYLIQGSKLALLMVLIVFILLFLYRRKGDFLINICFYFFAFVLVFSYVPSSNIVNWVKSIVFIRTLGTPGWTIVHYYEYFKENGYSYYGHIGIIDYIFGNYPYGDLALGQLIGIEYSGSEEANFNANFWSSDGIAAIGVFGMLLASLFLSFVLRFLDFISKNYDLKFVFLMTIGFWQALLNIPLSTSIFSGGGVVLLLILIFDVLLNRNKKSVLFVGR